MMNEGLGIALAAGSGALAGAGVWWLVRRLRVSPQERERKRRLMVNAAGRMVDGHVTDAHDELVHYTYSVRGVTYQTSQDVSTLRDRVPRDPALLIGGVTVKYSTRNPADSIIVCEHWSGFRQPGVARAVRKQGWDAGADS